MKECKHEDCEEINGSANHGEAQSLHYWCKNCGAIALEAQYGIPDKDLYFCKGWQLPKLLEKKNEKTI